MVMFPKIDFYLCYPRLFQVFLRPSFGAYAPPSPNLAFITYNFLRRVGRLQTFSPQLSRKNKYFPPSGKTSNLFASNVKKKQVFPDRQKDFLFFNSAVLNCAVESVPTRRTICKFLTKLGEMPSPRPIISIRIKRQRGASSAIK